VLEVAKDILLIVSALFPIVNPLGGSPIFLTLTHEYAPATRRQLAQRIALNSFVLLVVSLVIGTHILAFFGISLPVVQVGGGLLVISAGWSMLDRKSDADSSRAQHSVNPLEIFRSAFYPLTLPLTVGPGSISVAIALGANEHHGYGANLVALISALIGSFLVAASIYLCYGFADRLAGFVGAAGMNVIMRLSSFLLVCIGVQILWNGVKALVVTLPFVTH
jgi:multiple antibiotic resistance protein